LGVATAPLAVAAVNFANAIWRISRLRDELVLSMQDTRTLWTAKAVTFIRIEYNAGKKI
jgi:hypothetical protein